jgi:stage III sporulation protein AH
MKKINFKKLSWLNNKSRKNQVIILTACLMIAGAGYVNYLNTNLVQVNSNGVISDLSKSTNEYVNVAELGDATLVNADVASIIESNVPSTSQANSSEFVSEVEKDVNKTASPTPSNNSNSETKTKDYYFENSKLERNQMYSEILETYTKLYDSDNITSEQKSLSADEITKLTKQKSAIMIAENLIKTKGIEDVVIFANDSEVSAIIKNSNPLTPAQIAQIQNIIARELSVDVKNIHISEK